MKKLPTTLILSLILAFSVVSVPLPTHAQTFTPDQQASLDSLRQQLVDLLLAQVAQLQQQLATMIAAQAQTQASIVEVNTRVDTVIQQQAPVLGTVAPVVPFAAIALSSEEVDYRDYTTFKLSSNRPIDIGQSELWINGSKVDVVFTAKNEGSNLLVTITPGIQTFTKINEYGNRQVDSSRIRLKSTDGQTLISDSEVFTHINQFSKPPIGHFKAE